MLLLPPEFITWPMLLLAAVVGACVGSFVNCWAWRYVAGENIWRGRSHCTTCEHTLGVADLVPIFSWLISGGKCRYCGQKVSVRYPATELALAATFALLVWRYGIGVQAAELTLFASALLFLSLVDLDTYIIPNGTVAFAVCVRALYLAAAYALGLCTWADLGYYVASAVGVLVVMLAIVLLADKLFGRASMGGGDLKLFAVAGLYFGWQQCIFLIVVACIIGIIFAMLSQGLPTRETAAAGADGSQASAQALDPQAAQEDESLLHRVIPFGPSIALACIITMLVGGPFIAWYAGLFL